MNNNETVVMVNYEGTQCETNNSMNYTMRLYVKCNKKIGKDIALPILKGKHECGYSVILEVDKGCPLVNMSVIFAFITMHAPLFAVSFIALGIALGIYGRSMWPTVIFGLVTFSFTALSMVSQTINQVILYECLLPLDAPLWSLWLSLFGSGIVGAIIAYFTAKFDWVGFILLGGWLGVTSTLFLTNIFARLAVAAFVLYKMWDKNRRMSLIVAGLIVAIPTVYMYVFNNITFWMCLIAIAAVYAYSAYIIKDLLITVATSLLGAYLAVRVNRKL